MLGSVYCTEKYLNISNIFQTSDMGDFDVPTVLSYESGLDPFQNSVGGVTMTRAEGGGQNQPVQS